MKFKRGNVNPTAIVTGLVLLIVAIIVSFQIVGNTSGAVTTAADNISNSGLPLASLFSSNGVVLLVFMAGLLIAMVVLSMSFFKGKR